MADVNLFIISGRIGGIGEVKTFGESKVVNVRLACKGWDSKERQEVTDWYDVTCWNRQADYISEYQSVGSKIVVNGRLKLRDKSVHYGETLEKPYKAFEVVASNVYGMGSIPTEEAPF